MRKAYLMAICVLVILLFTFVPAFAQTPKLPKFVRFASLTVGMSAYYVAVGIGTVITALTVGYSVQLFFRLGGYDRKAKHMNLYELAKSLTGR